MKRSPVFVALVGVAISVTTLSWLNLPLSAQGFTADDMARFVSGRPVSSGSSLQQLMNNPSVQKHYAETGKLTEQWESGRLTAIRQWSFREVQPRVERPTTLKYMFGGPDFVHAVTVFPGVPEYILAGLEPLGTLPDFFAMDETTIDRYLSHLNHTLRSISRRNFFITKEMREDFGKDGIDGVFPVLLYFASITGHEVLEANYVKLNGDGQAIQSGAAEANGIWLRIRETEPRAYDPPAQNVYYFKTDLSDSVFKNGSSFHRFLSARPGSIGYLKAASFLMHTDAFSNIRNYLVGDCRYLLQDASGVPAEFMSRYYNLTLYGNYVGPIDMFSEYDQPWLHQAYRGGGVRPLPFGTGYRMKDSDSIQIFGVRK